MSTHQIAPTGRARSNSIGNGNGTAAGGLTSAESKPIDMSTWMEKLQKVEVTKQELDDLVMNFLIIEGYKEAAELFYAEQKQQKTPFDFGTIEERQLIRTAIQQGNIADAISRINEFDPEILDSTPKIFFHLMLQRMIEAIREERLEDALAMAQNELAASCEGDADYLRELEDVMLLLVFDVKNVAALDPLAKALLAPAQRIKTANEVNVALLSSQGQEQESKLPLLLRVLRWLQAQLGMRTKYPQLDADLCSPSFCIPQTSSPANGDSEYAMEIDATAAE